MKRTGVLISALVMLAALALPALGAQRGPAWPSAGPSPHGHMLVFDVEVVNGVPVGFADCIDLASNQVIPIRGHHLHQHVGTAGDAHFQSGDWVVPTSPITPYADCAALDAAFN